MKQLIIFLALVAVCAARKPGVRIRFDVGIRPGTDFFYKVPETIAEAILQRWSLTQRSIITHSTLSLYCPADRILCAYFDDNGHIAGLQIAMRKDEYTDNPYDWVKQGFREWVPASTGDIIEYWAISQFFVSEEYLATPAADREAARDSSKLLQQDAVWLTGYNGQIDQVSSKRTDIEESVYTKQACIVWMGRHFYHNMTKEVTCEESTMYPWFLLVNSGELVGAAYMGFGKLAEVEGRRNWFERPARSAVESIVPNGPDCLYEMAENTGVVTMHIYYIDQPWFLGCLFE